jgi:hypothetical protein
MSPSWVVTGHLILVDQVAQLPPGLQEGPTFPGAVRLLPFEGSLRAGQIPDGGDGPGRFLEEVPPREAGYGFVTGGQQRLRRIVPEYGGQVVHPVITSRARRREARTEAGIDHRGIATPQAVRRATHIVCSRDIVSSTWTTASESASSESTCAPAG